ncbi:MULTISPECIES: DUF4350 domain-containing protein [Actinomyces]|uniref:DUF4350 domain-containing protein n=1 Tax=Actinomyces respiraculi TaxID=2744574 RepID=A0A7T0LLK5_9ACTO|nr:MULTISPECIES: DUF4350 domain-containing protein [Actinomyces]QPL05847.1 DUF4350 domain-containing protein [Actinomyces respiraculi]
MSAPVEAPSWARRLRSWRPLLLSLALLAAVAVATSLLTSPQTSTTPYALDNPKGDGAMALGALLRDEGVGTASPTSMAEVVSQAGPGTTIALLNASHLSKEERRTLASLGADITVVGTLYQDLSGLLDDEGELPVPAGISAPKGTVLQARCADADAAAAGSIDGTRGTLVLPTGTEAIGCFPVSEGGSDYAYAVIERPGGATLRLISDTTLLTNGRIATAGHAALAIRALGHHEQLLWVDGSRLTTHTTVWNSVALPPWLAPLLFQAIIIVAVLAVVRGRRMGRLAQEDLPVLVRATETTRGRGRLYRRAGDRQRAATALRAGTALRLGRRLGLSPSADGALLTDALARATSQSAPAVQELLYGPVPSDDRSLADLAVQLDHLESEVTSR